MKLKYYLKGIGVGILFATIILSISFAVYNNENEKKTQDDIIAAALAAGMVWPEESTPEDTTPEESTPQNSTSEQDSTTSTADVTTTEPTSGQVPTSEQTTTPVTETTPEETTPEETTPEETTPEETTTQEPETTTKRDPADSIISRDDEKVVIQISKGMNSYDVAKILEKAGILKDYYDREAFNDYLIAEGYSRYVMIGVFEIPTGSSYDDIIKIICRT